MPSFDLVGVECFDCAGGCAAKLARMKERFDAFTLGGVEENAVGTDQL